LYLHWYKNNEKLPSTPIASPGVLLKNGTMGVVINVFAVMLALLGCLFVIGYQGQSGRLLIGLILIGAGIVLFVSSRLRPKQTTLVQKVDLTGDISTQELKCKNCGSTLTNKSVAVRAGAIFISCEFCGTQYQLEEAPKW
jgi:hypothetical protein